jgi:hypothetical protein
MKNLMYLLLIGMFVFVSCEKDPVLGDGDNNDVIEKFELTPEYLEGTWTTVKTEFNDTVYTDCSNHPKFENIYTGGGIYEGIIISIKFTYQNNVFDMIIYDDCKGYVYECDPTIDIKNNQINSYNNKMVPKYVVDTKNSKTNEIILTLVDGNLAAPIGATYTLKRE